MYKNKFFPFECKNDSFIYDCETGIVSQSTETINRIIEKINLGYDRERIIKLLNDNKKYNNNLLELESNFNSIEKYVEKNDIPIEARKNLVRTNKNVFKEDWYEGKVLNKMWLSVTHNCNMNCSYCFAGGGTYGSKGTMTKETAKKCIDFFFKYVKKNSKTIYINFFGGEPLLNKEVFIYATNYINKRAEEKGFKTRYTVTTNGTIMDEEILKTISKNNMNINISIDGGRETHDRNRKLANGKETFNLIENNVNRILKDYKNIIARVTLTKPGIKNFKSDILYLWNMGFPYIYFDPVVTDIEELALDESSMDTFEIQIQELREIMEQEILKGKNKFISNILEADNLISEKIVKAECMYYNPFTVKFTPEGDIYKCSITFGKKDECAGNVNKGIIWEKYKKTFLPNKKCLDCWAKRICGGGCHLREKTNVYCRYQQIIAENTLKFFVFMEKNKINI